MMLKSPTAPVKSLTVTAPGPRPSCSLSHGCASARTFLQAGSYKQAPPSHHHETDRHLTSERPGGGSQILRQVRDGPEEDA
jgi:hypothetical protein